MKSIARQYLDSLMLTPDQATALHALGEYRGKQALFSQQTPQILENLRVLAMIESGESSNRLEGITAPRKRIQALMQQDAAPRNRSEQEIAGYRDALDHIHNNHSKLDFSINTILNCHAMMYKFVSTPSGRWKTRDNVILERYADGSERILFRPTAADETAGAMEKLVVRYNMAVYQDRVEPLIVVPLTILDFLCIHPFGDGNGRCSRLLTLLLLYHHGYKVGRYISLDRVFEGSKRSYYDTLEASSQQWNEEKHNVFPWMTYFWGVVLAAYKEFEARVGAIQTAHGAKADQVRYVVDRFVGPFNISDIEVKCPEVSHDWVRMVLRQMRDEGLIEIQGKGRGPKLHKVKQQERRA